MYHFKHVKVIHLFLIIVEVDLVGKIDLDKQKREMDLFLKNFCETNFSKRQAKIIAFISFLARQNNEGIAYIPKLSHFENCGVGRNHIKRELEQLVKEKVILWNKDKMLFQINYFCDFWQKKEGHKVDRDLCDYLTELNTY